MYEMKIALILYCMIWIERNDILHNRRKPNIFKFIEMVERHNDNLHKLTIQRMREASNDTIMIVFDAPCKLGQLVVPGIAAF